MNIKSRAVQGVGASGVKLAEGGLHQILVGGPAHDEQIDPTVFKVLEK